MEAVKEKDGKLQYELDFMFIKQLAERMSENKGKYPPYNWMNLDNVDDLKQALYRHVNEVMIGNYSDDGRTYGHLEALALNAMFITYQLRKNAAFKSRQKGLLVKMMEEDEKDELLNHWMNSPTNNKPEFKVGDTFIHKADELEYTIIEVMDVHYRLQHSAIIRTLNHDAFELMVADEKWKQL